MAPKRFKKVDKNVKSPIKYNNLKLSDVLCPICRGILVEPVTLPCSHGFCYACFDSTMENTSLTCPLCRVRIGSWLRSARKMNKVINEALWQEIQKKFSKELQQKYDGEDEGIAEDVNITLATPGEIRTEFEKQLQKERHELKKKHEADTKASEIVIKKMLEEEVTKARAEEEKIRLDEEIARRLTEELSKTPSKSTPSKSTPSSSKSTPKKSSIDKYLVALNKRKQKKKSLATTSGKSRPSLAKTSAKSSTAITNFMSASSNSSSSRSTNSTLTRAGPAQPVEKVYTSTVTSQPINLIPVNSIKKMLLMQSERADSDSSDSIKEEMRYFKPIRLIPKSIPRVNPEGVVSQVSLLKVAAVEAQRDYSAVIRPPLRTMNIVSHQHSAFVRCSTQPVVEPTPPTSSVTEDRKVVKQYYNKRRKYIEAPHTVTDSTECTSPVLSDRLNGVKVRLPVYSTASSQQQCDFEFACRLQEELNNPRNRQYTTRARNHSERARNHSERARNPPERVKTKRQTTLDELVSPKKFKT